MYQFSCSFRVWYFVLLMIHSICEAFLWVFHLIWWNFSFQALFQFCWFHLCFYIITEFHFNILNWLPCFIQSLVHGIGTHSGVCVLFSLLWILILLTDLSGILSGSLLLGVGITLHWQFYEETCCLDFSHYSYFCLGTCTSGVWLLVEFI